jgi:hypothetical protein
MPIGTKDSATDKGTLNILGGEKHQTGVFLHFWKGNRFADVRSQLALVPNLEYSNSKTGPHSFPPSSLWLEEKD